MSHVLGWRSVFVLILAIVIVVVVLVLRILPRLGAPEARVEMEEGQRRCSATLASC